jgi:hypothetical protein
LFGHVNRGSNRGRGKGLPGAGSGASISSKSTHDSKEVFARALRPANVTAILLYSLALSCNQLWRAGRRPDARPGLLLAVLARDEVRTPRRAGKGCSLFRTSPSAPFR